MAKVLRSVAVLAGAVALTLGTLGVAFPTLAIAGASLTGIAQVAGAIATPLVLPRAIIARARGAGP